MEFDICCLGELLVDFVASRSDGDCYRFCPGGAPANVAVGAARLGLRSVMVSCVGADVFGDRLIACLQAEGVSTLGIQRTGAAFTTMAFVGLDATGEREFFFARHPGADARLEADPVSMELVERSKALHFGSLSLTSDLARKATLEAIRRARLGGAVVSMDVNYRAALWPCESAARRSLLDVLPLIDVLKVSAEEALLLTHDRDPVAAALKLRGMGPQIALVTMGAAGCLCARGADVAGISGLPVEAVDTNGAGDSFMAAFLADILPRLRKATLADLSMEVCVAACGFAVAAASVTVTRSGAMPALPRFADIGALQAEIARVTDSRFGEKSLC